MKLADHWICICPLRTLVALEVINWSTKGIPIHRMGSWEQKGKKLRLSAELDRITR